MAGARMQSLSGCRPTSLRPLTFGPAGNLMRRRARRLSGGLWTSLFVIDANLALTVGIPLASTLVGALAGLGGVYLNDWLQRPERKRAREDARRELMRSKLEATYVAISQLEMRSRGHVDQALLAKFGRSDAKLELFPSTDELRLLAAVYFPRLLPLISAHNEELHGKVAPIVAQISGSAAQDLELHRARVLEAAMASATQVVQFCEEARAVLDREAAMLRPMQLAEPPSAKPA